MNKWSIEEWKTITEFLGLIKINRDDMNKFSFEKPYEQKNVENIYYPYVFKLCS